MWQYFRLGLIPSPSPHVRHGPMVFRAKLSSRNKDTELSAGIASLRADFAGLLLRMEEGELQKDRFVREVRKRGNCGENFTGIMNPNTRRTIVDRPISGL